MSYVVRILKSRCLQPNSALITLTRWRCRPSWMRHEEQGRRPARTPYARRLAAVQAEPCARRRRAVSSGAGGVNKTVAMAAAG